MKKVFSGTVTALVVTGLLSGCGYSNNQGASNRPGTGMNNVGYYNNQPGKPNQYNMNQPVAPKSNKGYTSQSQQAMLIRQRVNQINGINNAQVLTNKNNVVVGVNVSSTKLTSKDVEKKVKAAVKNVVKNKHIYVTTDPAMVTRITNVNNRLTNGSAGNEVRSDVKGIVNDLSDAVKRPFENNSK